MRVCLVANRVKSDPRDNLLWIRANIALTLPLKPDLILFPEMCLTGLVNNDDPSHDRNFAEPVPGPITSQMAKIARESGAWIGFGILEKDGDTMYDTAVLLEPNGNIALKYRRITPGWHGKNASLHIYKHGHQLVFAQTPFGKTTFLICGDLFDHNLLDQTKASEPELVLVPMARSHQREFQPELWYQQERGEYLEKANQLDSLVLIVNYVGDDGCFGGGFVVNQGHLIGELKPGKAGVFFAEIPG